MTKNNLLLAISLNPELNRIFSLSDPEEVAFIVQNELNNIINDLAPCTIKQRKKNYAPYIGPDLRVEINNTNTLLTQAIQSKLPSDWLKYRTYRNSTQAKIAKSKAEYLSKGYACNKTKWKQINNVINNNQQVTPNRIINNGEVLSKPRDVANLANTHYAKKIQNIRQKFKNDIRDPMTILEALIPRGTLELSIPLITLAQSKHLVSSFKSSSSTGYDALSSKTLKKCGDAIAPHLCHMINCILRTSTFPSCFKITKIIPILKPGKPADQIDSFRPINCLPTLEKLVEGWISKHINDWAISSDLIPA